MTPCLIWDGPINPNGYGRTQVGGKTQMAHRAAWEQVHGPIPEGLEIDHLCRVRACVNPDHLEAVTHVVNVRRGLGNQTKTHCPQGHAYDEANTRITPAGRRSCRACNRERQRRRLA